MSLTDNADSIAFASQYSTDKIVFVREGTFDRATDVITVTGDLGSIYVYPIAHGYTRPIAADLIFSTDGASWADGGSSTASGSISIAYSDNTYVYIVSSIFAPAAGTFYYKVVGLWIDSYDGTNPAVDPYHSTTKETLFDTRNDYQKIYREGVLNFTSASTQTVAHPLGRRINYRVFFEAFAGQVWPAFAGGASNPFFYDTTMTECDAYMTTSALGVELITVPSTRRAWYKIYLDN